MRNKLRVNHLQKCDRTVEKYLISQCRGTKYGSPRHKFPGSDVVIVTSNESEKFYFIGEVRSLCRKYSPYEICSNPSDTYICLEE